MGQLIWSSRFYWRQAGELNVKQFTMLDIKFRSLTSSISSWPLGLMSSKPGWVDPKWEYNFFLLRLYSVDTTIITSHFSQLRRKRGWPTSNQIGRPLHVVYTFYVFLMKKRISVLIFMFCSLFKKRNIFRKRKTYGILKENYKTRTSPNLSRFSFQNWTLNLTNLPKNQTEL